MLRLRLFRLKPPLFFSTAAGSPQAERRHLPDQPRDRRVFERQRNRRRLHPPHRVVIVGNLPLRRTRQRLGDLILGDAQRARLDSG